MYFFIYKKRKLSSSDVYNFRWLALSSEKNEEYSNFGSSISTHLNMLQYFWLAFIGVIGYSVWHRIDLWFRERKFKKLHGTERPKQVRAKLPLSLDVFYILISVCCLMISFQKVTTIDSRHPAAGVRSMQCRLLMS